MSGNVGILFRVTRPDLHFPRDFTVIDETEAAVRLRNSDATYWVTRRRFAAALGERFVQAKQGSR